MSRSVGTREQGFLITGLVAVVVAMATASPASAKELCVGGGGCFATIQDAVDAARSGDEIKLKPGTHKGGATIDKSVSLIGAGAERTVIRGGGPVLTIGTFGADHQPRVSISNVTITDGVTRSSPQSEDFTGEDGVFALGGGIEALPTKDLSSGAKVTVSDSVIAGNRVIPRKTVPGGPPCPGDRHCGFAFAGGGGIDTWGDLKLVNTTVRDNRVGAAARLSGPTSDADGGGITSRGSLVLVRSRVIENRATATAPSGRFAEGGGIYAPSGEITLRDSAVSRNRSVLRTSFPSTVDLLAIGGGMQLADGITSVRIDDTRIAHNLVVATNEIGSVSANSGALNLTTVEASMRVTDSALAHNRIRAVVRGRHGNAVADSGAATLLGVVADTAIVDNSATARSRGGNATASGGGVLIFGRLIDSEVADNSVTAKSPHGRARAAGGGIEVDFKPLTLNGTVVVGNSVTGLGERGSARGGGIFNWKIFSSGSDLALFDSAVQGNSAQGSVDVQGGGIYAHKREVNATASAISGNLPDQCFGC